MNQLKLLHCDMQFLMRFVLNLWLRKCQKSWANLLSCVNKLMRIFNIINLHNLKESLCNQQMLWSHLQKWIHSQEIQLQSSTILWILTMHDSMLQLIQKNKRTTSQRVHVLIAVKKNIDIKIVSWTHTVKYIKLSYSMRMNEFSLSKKHTLCSW